MMKKVWKNRKGVSPVIATILMVAITVVLAAVLYVMVMGFNQGGNATPTGVLSATKNGATYTVTLTSISKNDVAGTDTRVVITPAPLHAPASNYFNAVLTNLPYAAGNKCTAGDYIQLTVGTGATDNLESGKTYTVSMLYTPTGNTIASTTISVP